MAAAVEVGEYSGNTLSLEATLFADHEDTYVALDDLYAYSISCDEEWLLQLETIEGPCQRAFLLITHHCVDGTEKSDADICMYLNVLVYA